jgi:replication factor C subunit 1
MDEYHLNNEDWDTLVELGAGDKRHDAVMKKISAVTKTSKV